MGAQYHQSGLAPLAGEFGNKIAGRGVKPPVPAASGTRELAFCPDCYAALPRGTRCRCDETGPDDGEVIARYRVAVDAPKARMLSDRTSRLVPAMAAFGVIALVALLAAIVR